MKVTFTHSHNKDLNFQKYARVSSSSGRVIDERRAPMEFIIIQIVPRSAKYFYVSVSISTFGFHAKLIKEY